MVENCGAQYPACGRAAADLASERIDQLARCGSPVRRDVGKLGESAMAWGRI